MEESENLESIDLDDLIKDMGADFLLSLLNDNDVHEELNVELQVSQPPNEEISQAPDEDIQIIEKKPPQNEAQINIKTEQEEEVQIIQTIKEEAPQTSKAIKEETPSTSQHHLKIVNIFSQLDKEKEKASTSAQSKSKDDKKRKKSGSTPLLPVVRHPQFTQFKKQFRLVDTSVTLIDLKTIVALKKHMKIKKDKLAKIEVIDEKNRVRVNKKTGRARMKVGERHKNREIRKRKIITSSSSGSDLRPPPKSKAKKEGRAKPEVTTRILPFERKIKESERIRRPKMTEAAPVDAKKEMVKKQRNFGTPQPSRIVSELIKKAAESKLRAESQSQAVNLYKIPKGANERGYNNPLVRERPTFEWKNKGAPPAPYPFGPPAPFTPWRRGGGRGGGGGGGVHDWRREELRKEFEKKQEDYGAAEEFQPAGDEEEEDEEGGVGDERWDNMSEEDEMPHTPPPPLSDVRVGNVAMQVDRLLKSGGVDLRASSPPPTPPSSEAEVGSTVHKLAWWFRTNAQESYSLHLLPPEVPENINDQAEEVREVSKNEEGGGGSVGSSFGNVSNPGGKDDTQINEVSSSDQSRMRDPDLLDEYCGCSLIGATFRVGGLSEEKFQKVLYCPPGSTYDKESFRAKCLVCNVQIKGKRDLGAHLRSESHKTCFKNISLNIMPKREMSEERVERVSRNPPCKEPLLLIGIEEEEERNKNNRERRRKEEAQERERREKREKDKEKERERDKNREKDKEKERERDKNREKDKDKEREKERERREKERREKERRNSSTTNERSKRSRSRSPSRLRKSGPLPPGGGRSASAERVQEFIARTLRSPDYGPRKRRRSRTPPSSSSKSRGKGRGEGGGERGSGGGGSGRNNVFPEILKLQAAGLWSEENENRWRINEAEEKRLSIEMSERRKLLSENVENHPDYESEWKKHWERRYQELEDEGIDPSKYDYVPGWKKYWLVRVEELLNQEHEDRLTKMRIKNQVDYDSIINIGKKASMLPQPQLPPHIPLQIPPQFPPQMSPQFPPQMSPQFPPQMSPHMPPQMSIKFPPQTPPLPPPPLPPPPPEPPAQKAPSLYSPFEADCSPKPMSISDSSEQSFILINNEPVLKSRVKEEIPPNPSITANAIQNLWENLTKGGGGGGGAGSTKGQSPDSTQHVSTTTPTTSIFPQNNYNNNTNAPPTNSSPLRSHNTSHMTSGNSNNSNTTSKLAPIKTGTSVVSSSGSSFLGGDEDSEDVDLLFLLNLMGGLEDQLSLFAGEVKSYATKAAELENSGEKGASKKLLSNKEFCVLMFQCRDKLMSLIRAQISAPSINRRMNRAVYSLNLLLDSPECAPHKPRLAPSIPDPTPPHITSPPPPQLDIKPHVNSPPLPPSSVSERSEGAVKLPGPDFKFSEGFSIVRRNGRGGYMEEDLSGRRVGVREEGGGEQEEEGGPKLEMGEEGWKLAEKVIECCRGMSDEQKTEIAKVICQRVLDESGLGLSDSDLAQCLYSILVPVSEEVQAEEAESRVFDTVHEEEGRATSPLDATLSGFRYVRGMGTALPPLPEIECRAASPPRPVQSTSQNVMITQLQALNEGFARRVVRQRPRSRSKSRSRSLSPPNRYKHQNKRDKRRHISPSHSPTLSRSSPIHISPVKGSKKVPVGPAQSFWKDDDDALSLISDEDEKGVRANKSSSSVKSINIKKEKRSGGSHVSEAESGEILSSGLKESSQLVETESKNSGENYPDSVTILTDLSSKKGLYLNNEQKALFKIIHQWTQAHAKLLKISDPESVLKSQDIVNLILSNVKTIEDVQKITQVENYELRKNSWEKTVFRLLTEGESFFSKIMSAKCHNCLEIGHQAWGCSIPYSSQNHKKWFDSDEAHLVFKRKQNKRRRENLKRKRQQASKN